MTWPAARARQRQPGSSCTRRWTTSVKANTAPVRRSRRSQLAFPRRAEPAYRSNRRGAAGRRRRPNGRPRWPTRRGKGGVLRGRLRRGVDGRSNARSNGRGGRRPRRRHWPDRRAAPLRGGPASIARRPRNGPPPPKGRAGAPLPPSAPRPPASAAATDHHQEEAEVRPEVLRGKALHCVGHCAREPVRIFRYRSKKRSYHLISMYLGRTGISE